MQQEDEGDDAPTAIFDGGGGDGEEWRRKLREAGRRAYPGFAGRAAQSRGRGDKELQEMEWDLEAATAEEDEAADGKGGKKKKKRRGADKKQKEEETVGLGAAERFKPRRVLRNHLDAVRVVACFEADGQELVVTGGDDTVVKLWRDPFGKTRCASSDRSSALVPFHSLIRESRAQLSQ